MLLAWLTTVVGHQQTFGPSGCPDTDTLRTMFQGRYIRWNPVLELEGARVYVEAVHDDLEGFRIWLRPPSPGSTIIVRFDSPLFYANSDEGKRLSKVENSEQMKFPHVFWTVEDSALIAEFHRQSLGVYDDLKIKHFAFLSCGLCIDVLSVTDPTFLGRSPL